VLAEARRAEVGKFVIPGVDPEGWDGIAHLANREEGIFPAFGLHPMLASRYHEGLLDEIEHYSCSACGVAIGEIGLDYTVAGVSREDQIAALRIQLRLAVRMGLPVLLHCRRAFQDLLRIVKEERVREVGGVMHAFSGSPEIARDFINEGLLLSISGTITYRNAVKPPEVAARIPLEHLVLETDAPDMTPEPFRGRENEPAFLRSTAEKLAEIKRISFEEVAAMTTATAERLFRI
jgi:TatD DNase family protein